MTARTALAATALALTGAAALSLSPGPSADAAPVAQHGVVEQVRDAIAPYRDVTAAIKDGYRAVSPCESSPEGGMGIHFMNEAYAAPGPVDPAKPPILLYVDSPGGHLRLVGAEFWQPAVGQPAPSLAGQPFDGPMPGHAPGMPDHYDLHVWTELANPVGVFAPWNRAVHCR